MLSPYKISVIWTKHHYLYFYSSVLTLVGVDTYLVVCYYIACRLFVNHFYLS